MLEGTYHYNCFLLLFNIQITESGSGCSAGIGVLNAARKTMSRMLGDTDIAFESARSQFWVVDANVSDLLPNLSVCVFLTHVCY